MEHTLKILSLLAVAMVLGISCVEEEQPEVKPEPVGKTVFLVGAKALSDEFELGVRWEAVKDKIGLFVDSDGDTLCTNLCYNAYSSTEASRFVDLSGKNPLVWKEGVKADVCAYYPYRSSYLDPEAIPCSVPAEQKLGVAPDLKKALLYASVSDASYAEEGVELMLKPVYSVVKVTLAFDRTVSVSGMSVTSDSSEPLAFSDGTVNIRSGQMTAGQESGIGISLKSEEPFDIGPDGKDIYFVLTPGHAGKHLTLIASMKREETQVAVLDVPEGGYERGKIYSYAATHVLPEQKNVNLSENASANTYIISKGGMVYSFDAKVKGNGIAREFQWTYDGEPCNVSWGDVDINPADVKVLWYNSPVSKDGTMSDVCPIYLDTFEYDSATGMVSFETPEPFVEGNLLVAAFSESEEILWSWNIWAVKDYDPALTAKQVGRFTVMDRNLGAFAGVETATSSEPVLAARSMGHYYQWGRKDPIPAPSSMTQVGGQWAMPTYTPIDSYKKADGRIFTDNRVDNVYCIGKEIGTTFTLQQAVEASVKNPHKAMANGTSDNADPYHWALPSYPAAEKYRTTADRTHWRTLWGSLDGYNSVKTIFDPCPPGWKVPTVDLFVYLYGGAELTSNEYGYYSDRFDVFLPNAGQRNAGFGGSNLVSVGSFAAYSSASANDPYIPFRGDVIGMTAHNSYGGAAYQMRCVKEEVSANAAPVGVQSGHRAVLMGDSITEQWPIRGRKEFFTSNDFKGVGISGQTSRDMLARMWGDVLSNDAQLVVVAAGTNDLAYNNGVKTSREDILSNVMLMVELSKAWGAEVIVGSSFPSRHYWWNFNGTVAKDFWNITPEQTAQRAIELGKILKAYAEQKGYRYADYFSVLKDDENNLADPYCYPVNTSYAADGLDRVHPNAAGYLEMEKVLKPLVDAALNDPNQINPGDSSIDDMGKIEW